ncbi:MAG: polysaccharide deacetylase family protein [Sulfuritalea sp.]|nr:polysaccharide deacetylase family protein [Sulfuritalea sp.]
MTRPAATVSIDLDDLWSYRRSFGLAESAATPSLLPIAIPRFLDFMEQHELRGTVFVVGHDAELTRHAWLFMQIARCGHELGNHSHDHAGDLESWSAERQRNDLGRAHAAIAAASGFTPRGFRGPSFRVSKSLLEAVQAMGYGYDASTFPNALGALARGWQRRRAERLGTQAVLVADTFGSSAARRLPLKPYAWGLPGGALVEVPVTTFAGFASSASRHLPAVSRRPIPARRARLCTRGDQVFPMGGYRTALPAARDRLHRLRRPV